VGFPFKRGVGSRFKILIVRLAANLTFLGVDPASLTKIIFTHAYPDHSGETTLPDGALPFPNADIKSAKPSGLSYGSELRDVQPEPLYAFARGAQCDLFAVKNRLTHVEIGDEIVSGLNVVSTRGHTPGHISLVQGGDGNLLKAGRRHPKRHRLLWQSEMAFRLRHRTGNRSREPRCATGQGRE